MLVKCDYHLHPLVEFEKGIVDQGVEEDNNLNICKMTIGMDLINRKLLFFKCYQVHVKNIKCPFQWWEKHENMFFIVGSYTKQILRIFGFQIEMERIFSLVRILTSRKRSHLQSKNLNILFFVNKNWPNDPRIGYNPFLVNWDSCKFRGVWRSLWKRWNDEVLYFGLKNLLQVFTYF